MSVGARSHMLSIERRYSASEDRVSKRQECRKGPRLTRWCYRQDVVIGPEFLGAVVATPTVILIAYCDC